MFSIVSAFLFMISVANVSYAINFSEAKIERVRTELPRVSNVNVCIGDVGEHGIIVSSYVSKYFEGDVVVMPYSKYVINEEYANCDVINHSIGVLPVFFGYSKSEREELLNQFKEEEYEKIDTFLSYYKGIVVESAGNESEESTFSSGIARYKQKNKDVKNDRLFVIGQIEKTKDDTYIHHFSYGAEIDFVVSNYDEYTNGERHNGTSFASPVVSGVIATLLEAGIPQQDIREIIGYEEDNHVYKGKEYKVFSIIKTYKNAYIYLDKNK